VRNHRRRQDGRIFKGGASFMSDSTTHPLILRRVAGITIADISSSKIGLDARDALLELADKEPGQKIILNFQNIQILSSAPIGTLVNLRNQLNSSGGSLALCRLDADIREILQLTRVEDLFSIFETEQEAIDSLNAVS
jgi:anti-anti-sigma factor